MSIYRVRSSQVSRKNLQVFFYYSIYKQRIIKQSLKITRIIVIKSKKFQRQKSTHCVHAIWALSFEYHIQTFTFYSTPSSCISIIIPLLYCLRFHKVSTKFYLQIYCSSNYSQSHRSSISIVNFHDDHSCPVDESNLWL